ncbi:hypothetical protein VII00023_11474 [Vibrio ichthyoenteri ATCC 700023]|uniref:C-type lysozyme inhibitor domain-containing protein n=1 Tax=Vibrio ichthyoenteri ATCC 700023 TaxID=870968 RepID=F9RZJ5_9VIBR|nr:MliC family protein [Vibrio ichthyoenteri]EGU44815.1 hypothetical protein VII00023_11474 [Vibrio ichthyoenteri ATCC 700023]
MVKVGILTSAVLLLAGCASSDNQTSANDSNQYQYDCDNQQQFSVTYLIEERGALVRVQDIDYALVQAPAGSGTRYILPNNALSEVMPVTLYTRGENARLEYGREVYQNCKIK